MIGAQAPQEERLSPPRSAAFPTQDETKDPTRAAADLRLQMRPAGTHPWGVGGQEVAEPLQRVPEAPGARAEAAEAGTPKALDPPLRARGCRRLPRAARGSRHALGQASSPRGEGAGPADTGNSSPAQPSWMAWAKAACHGPAPRCQPAQPSRRQGEAVAARLCGGETGTPGRWWRCVFLHKCIKHSAPRLHCKSLPIQAHC